MQCLQNFTCHYAEGTLNLNNYKRSNLQVEHINKPAQVALTVGQPHFA